VVSFRRYHLFAYFPKFTEQWAWLAGRQAIPWSVNSATAGQWQLSVTESGHYYGQLMMVDITGQQLHRSVNMGSMLDTGHRLEATATMLQMTT